jgi:hypothetical protein
MNLVRTDTTEDTRPAAGDGSIDVALARVFAGSSVLLEEVERLRSRATELAHPGRGSASGAGMAGIAHALAQLEYRRADLELACLALGGAVTRSAGDH